MENGEWKIKGILKAPSTKIGGALIDRVDLTVPLHLVYQRGVGQVDYGSSYVFKGSIYDDCHILEVF